MLNRATKPLNAPIAPCARSPETGKTELRRFLRSFLILGALLLGSLALVSQAADIRAQYKSFPQGEYLCSALAVSNLIALAEARSGLQDTAIWDYLDGRTNSWDAAYAGYSASVAKTSGWDSAAAFVGQSGFVGITNSWTQAFKFSDTSASKTQFWDAAWTFCYGASQKTSNWDSAYGFYVSAHPRTNFWEQGYEFYTTASTRTGEWDRAVALVDSCVGRTSYWDTAYSTALQTSSRVDAYDPLVSLWTSGYYVGLTNSSAIALLTPYIQAQDYLDRAYAYSLFQAALGTNSGGYMSATRMLDVENQAESWLEYRSNSVLKVSVTGGTTNRVSLASSLVPYSGATTNVDLGTNSILASSFTGNLLGNAATATALSAGGDRTKLDSTLTNNQTGVTLGLASGTTVATATAGSEPVSLDQALSLLSSSSTVYLSPTMFTGGQDGVTNRTLATMYSPTAWTVVYSGAVSAGQYLFSFTAPSNLVTSVLAGNQTANIYMTYAGGGGSTLTCKMEGYIFDPATTNSVEYAETSATFAPAKSGTLPSTPSTPIAVIPVATNLTGDLRYQMRIKAITANNVTSVTMWGGSNSISSVSFPVSDSVIIGARGATSIQSSTGVQGTYDSTERRLTMPEVAPMSFTPIINTAGGTVFTCNWTTARSIYNYTATAPNTFTNVFSGISTNCTTNTSVIVGIDYTVTNALSTVWDPRIEWVGLASATPDLTVTGRYEFAFSTSCGTKIQGRQTYPTVYQWEKMLPMAKNAAVATSPFFQAIVLASNTETNTTHYWAYPITTEPKMIRLYGFFNGGPTAFSNSPTIAITGLRTYSGITVTTGFPSAIAIPRTAIGFSINTYLPTFNGSGYNEIMVLKASYATLFTSSATSAIVMSASDARKMTELEIKAYNAGWRP